MVINLDHDTAHLARPEANSGVAGYCYFSNHLNISKHPGLNVAVHIECKTLRHAVSFAAAAEYDGLFYNAGVSLEIRYLLQVLGHKQPITPIKLTIPLLRGFFLTIFTKKGLNIGHEVLLVMRQTQQLKFNIFGTKESTIITIIGPNITRLRTIK